MAQEVDILVEEIEELNRVLRELNRTVIDTDASLMKSFGKQVDRNTKELKDNNDALSKNTKNLKQGIILVDKWGQEVKESTKAVEENTEAQKKLAGLSIKEGQQLERDLRDRMRHRSVANSLFEEFDRGVSVTSILKTQFENLGGTSLGATTALKLITAAGEGLTNATVAMTKSLYKGERGAAVTAKALGELVEPIADVATTFGSIVTVLSLFGPAGLIGRGIKILGVVLGALGLAAKAASEANKVAAEQTDRLLKSFREVSQFGVTFADGADGVFRTMQLLGMTAAELDQFNDMISKNAKSLALMGGTIGQGAQAFADVAGGLYKSDLGYQLEMLGVSAQEQRESALAYMAIQARTGQLQLKNTQKLIEESSNFVKELDMAAQLTGQSRKDQMAAREAALAEVRFRSALIDAERRGDTAEMARLGAAQRAAALARGFGDERGFTGILQAAAGRGALTTPEAVAAEMTYGVSKIMAQPNATDAQILDMMGRSVDVQQRQLSGINRYTGGIDALQTNVIATADLLKRQEILQKEAARAGFTGPTAVTDFLQTEQGKRIAAGGTTKDMIQAGRTQQAAAMTMDSVVKSFNYAAELNKSASETFANAVNKFAKATGASAPAGGVPGQTTPGGGGGAVPVVRPGKGGGAGGGAVGPSKLAGAAAKNLNPGNLRFIGQEGAVMGSGGFAKFETVDAGLVALAKDINAKLTGRSRHGKLDTIGTLISKYAPPNENDTRAYIEKMATFMGMTADGKLSDSDPATLAKVMTGIIGVENFGDPNKGYNFRGGVQTAVAQLFGIEPSKVGKFQRGGVSSGPLGGYAAVLHGTEAIVPLPDGRSIPVTMPDFASGMTKQMEAMSAQISRLDEMVSLMRNQVTLSDKILRASQN